MALEDMEKKYRISDIARELQVSPQEVLLFVKKEGGKVASTSSMVNEEIHDQIFGHFSVEKKMVDETKKIRAEKEKRLSRLEEQSRKTYEKEKHLSETLSPPPAPTPILAPVPAPAPAPVLAPVPAVAAEVKNDAVQDTTVKDQVFDVAVEPEVPVAPIVAEVLEVPEVVVIHEVPDLPVVPDIVEVPEIIAVAEPVEPIELVALPESEPEPIPAPAPQREEPTVNEHLVSFDAPQMMGGLTVLGTLDIHAGRHKKNRKKNFKEQADALKDEFEPKVTEEVKVEEKVVTAKKPAKVATEVKPKPVVAGEGSGIKKKKGKKKKKPEVDDKVISANIQKTISGIEERSSTGSRQKFRKMRRNEREREHEEDEALREAQRMMVRVTEYASPHELAELMGITAKEIIQKCFALGKFVTINQRLDKESIELIALEFGFEAEFISEVEATAVVAEEDAEDDLQTRPPVVTIMGHVDHGKTSLLDYIRSSKVVAGECQEISAKKGIGIAELMEKVLTEAEMRELKGNYSREINASGIIVESELDKGKGVISTVLVQRGILKVGDPFVAGNTMGKVRALMDERGKRILFANPSQPVRVLGFEDLPQSSDVLTVMSTDRDARDLAQKRQVIRREHDFRRSTRVKLDSIARQIKEGLMKELSVIIKADTDGSIQALADGLMKIQNDEVKVQIIHQGVGQITETDVLLAAASDAIIIGFRVRPNVNAKKLAEKEDLDVRFYSVIYHVLEDVEKALEGMLSPELHEESLGSLEVRQVFKVPKIGNVGGCYVLEGKVFRDSKVRLLRDGVQIYEGQLAALRRFKDDVKEVDAGYECGMSLKNYDDIKVGDIVEAYKIVEKKRKL
ncbi:MAG: translation initiation factor IF-2 [Chlorobiales bacterium]|nr:translation initiation factor IF-2 [Chlorobiales bacterium]